MLELYHNALSTCSQKVRLVLSEKGLSYETHDVDLLGGGQHDPEYVKLNPNHVVPTLVHDGAVLIESTLINEYLDDAFPDPALRPADPEARHGMRLWTQRIDSKVHPAAGVVTFAIGPRAMLLQQPEEVREANIAAIPDPARRAARRSVIENGVKAPEFAGALERFLDLLDDMESALSGQSWLSGEGFGLADAAALPYVLRLDHLAMSPLLEASARPNLADWYGRVKARPSYEPAVTAWIPEPVLALFGGAGKEVWPDVEPLTRRS
ncbi:MAG: glutathione S-transferase family protein [Myxococcota bacterium]|nr:glutathione S-transferase family protein [Myxococcota bacterium]